MDEFAILTNRRRAIIALAHSIVFLLIAAWQMRAAPSQGLLVAPSGGWVLCGIYGMVTTVLLGLFAASRGWMEKVYFALCAASATSGLLRTIIGDHGFHAARSIRVVMLTSAVVVGLAIVRAHSELRERSADS